MIENKKYLDFIQHQTYDKIDPGEKIPIGRPHLTFRVVETASEPRLIDFVDCLFFPYRFYSENMKFRR